MISYELPVWPAADTADAKDATGAVVEGGVVRAADSDQTSNAGASTAAATAVGRGSSLLAQEQGQEPAQAPAQAQAQAQEKVRWRREAGVGIVWRVAEQRPGQPFAQAEVAEVVEGTGGSAWALGYHALGLMPPPAEARATGPEYYGGGARLLALGRDTGACTINRPLITMHD